MRTSRFTNQQVIKILAEASSGMTVAQVCAKHGISVPTFYLWKSKQARSLEGTAPPPAVAAGNHSDPGDADNAAAGAEYLQLTRRISELERENGLLRKLFVEASLHRATGDGLGKNLSIPDIA